MGAKLEVLGFYIDLNLGKNISSTGQGAIFPSLYKRCDGPGQSYS